MQFLYPNVFFMMLIPLVLLIVLILTSKDTMQRYFSKDILKRLNVGTKSIGKTFRNGLLFTTLLLFIVALGRPVINEKEQNIKQSLIPIVIAVDLSKSMKANDIYPNRLSLAKQKLQQIIKLSTNSTIGVLLFAKNSFILSPVTEDFVSLKYIVDNLDTNLEFDNGSNIFSVLEATSLMLKDYKVKNLIILSDGGNDNSYTKEAEFASQNDISIYSIGLATKQGSPIPIKNGYLTDTNGEIVNVKLNLSIKNLSLQTQGGYIDFSLDNSDVAAILNQINKQSKKEELTTQKVKTYTELFYYPLALGVFMLLFSFSSFPNIRFRKKDINGVVILLATIIVSSNSEASVFEFENIEKATVYYNNKEYKEAGNEYRNISSSPQSLYNLGNTLYKDKKYKEAIDTYNKVVSSNQELESKKLHNIANSYVNLNNLEKAKEFYEKSLKLNQNKQTQENLDMVKKELENKENKENKKKDKKQDEKKDKEKQKEKKKSEKQDKKQDKNKEDKKEKDKKKSDKDEKTKNESKEHGKKEDQKDKKMKKEPISDMEEKKWMDMLNKEKQPLYLQRVKTKNQTNHNDEQPW